MAAQPARHRSKAACQFCRTRKLKCDNLEPECSACRSRSIECVYVQRVAAPRPSNAAIQALQAENKRLRRLLEFNKIDVNDGNPLSPDDGGGGSEMTSPDGRIQALQRENEQRGEIDPFGNSHDEARRQSIVPFDPQLDPGTDPASSMNDSYAPRAPLFEQTGEHYAVLSELDPTTRDMLRHQLVAASARQRQMEMLPINNQQNDYDGYDPNLVHHLLNIHWNRQHHNLLLIYRPLFMRDWGTGGPYFSKLLLNAMLFAAAKFSPRTEIRKDPNWAGSAGYQFRERFTTLLGEAMGESRITTIQALITLASSLFAIETTAKSTAWLYSGIAFRMIIDLGLNVDGVELLKRQKISPEELECRRRVFWGAFSFDKIHSMYFGRPVTLQETNMRVPIEFLDDHEELEQWTPVEQLNSVSADYPLPAHPGGPSYSVTTFAAMCNVSVVLGRILNDIYSETAYNHGTNLTQAQNQLFAQTQKVLDDSLESCAMQFPLEIRFEPWATGEPLSIQRTPTPTVLSLHCLYHISMILLHRPYLTKGHLYDERLAATSLQKCTAAAIRLAHIARVYCHAFTVRRTPYFIAYSAYVAITILIRVSAHLPQGSSAQQSLHICLGILSDSEKTNQGVKRASFVVSKLLFAVARSGPNPFPDSEIHKREPWGETVNDRIELSREAMVMIISTFSTTSPDAAAEQSQLEVHPQDPGINGHVFSQQAQQQQQLTSPPLGGEARSFNDMDSGTAAQLLASLRTNTPVISTAPSPKMTYNGGTFDSMQAFPDTIFGLHSDESFQSWPDFSDHLENLLYGGNLMSGLGPEGNGGS